MHDNIKTIEMILVTTKKRRTVKPNVCQARNGYKLTKITIGSDTGMVGGSI
jgi:hypothetical protein